MTNEEKALNLSGLKETPDYEERYYNSTYCLVYDKCLEMAKWKDEQFAKEKERLVEKAVEWLLNNATDHLGFNPISESFSLSWDFIDLFKQAMEE